jgi:hypothetical protein
LIGVQSVRRIPQTGLLASSEKGFPFAQTMLVLRSD